MNPDWPLVFTLLCVALFLFAVACQALREFIRHDLEKLCQRAGRDGFFSLIMDHYQSVRTGLEMLAGLVWLALPVVGEKVVWDGTHCRWVALAGCVVAVFASAFWVPRPLGDLYATRIVFHLFHPLRWASWLGLPLIWCSRFFEVLILRLAGVPQTVLSEEDSIEEEIRSIVTEGHRDGFIKDDARVMIEGIMQLDDASVSAIMTPRTEMFSICRDATWEELMEFVTQTQLSRIPVYGQNRDDILGVLYSKDLLGEWRTTEKAQRRHWTELLHEPFFVPETKQIHILLREFLQTRTHFAIVLDEYGGVTGVVTLEDILEEIVGEIADETDEAPVMEIVVREDGSAELLARAHIDEINAQLGLELPESSDFETIGGLILTRLGKVPQKGEVVEWDESLRFEILAATARKIERVRLTRPEEPFALARVSDAV